MTAADEQTTCATDNDEAVESASPEQAPAEEEIASPGRSAPDNIAKIIER